MHTTFRQLVFVVLLLGITGSAFAQGTMPTTQPNVLMIIREEVKVGHAADHAKTEAGWPAAFEKAKFPYNYLAFVSLTGPSEAWFVAPYESHAALADSMKRESDDPALSAELERLSREDSAHVNSIRTLHCAARKDLSYGSFPDTTKQRFWEISLFRVRPGHEASFAAAAKAYGAAAGRAAPGTSYRVYEVIAGIPGPTYVIFSSVASFGEFDKMMTDGEATMKGLTAEERAALQKFSAEGLVNVETQRFRLDPGMSYVPGNVRSQDPGFWIPKKPSM
jgi:hypothetical protein